MYSFSSEKSTIILLFQETYIITFKARFLKNKLMQKYSWAQLFNKMLSL